MEVRLTLGPSSALATIAEAPPPQVDECFISC